MVVLIVDGYNVIGAWQDLAAIRDKDLSQARDLLIERMAEYQAYTGHKVIIVFDAYEVRGLEKKQLTKRVEVIYTKENETADERIEKLIKEVKNVKTQVYVATSDFTEQRTIFALGALRKSARELRMEVDAIEKEIKQELRSTQPVRNTKIPLSDDILKVFEKWRRGEK
jgi:uncharacterized protein